MQDLAGLDTNFRFLVLKVTRQIEHVELALGRPEEGLFRRMKMRDDYIDHLKSIIENKCFSLLRQFANLDKAVVNSLRSMNVITANLEHIADNAVSVARQMSHFTQPTFFQRYECRPFFAQIFQALGLVLEAYEQRDAAKAMQICRAEMEIDRLYKDNFERILTEMQAGGDVANLVTSLFIFHYLERMGDSLLNVGEAILFNKLGEKLKLNQYEHLRDTLAALRGAQHAEVAEQLDFQGIWGTRSGCHVGKVSEGSRQFQADQDVIYKGGDVRKIRDEKEGIERLGKIAPGLAPRVVEYQEGEQEAAILLEFLEGQTLQQIVLEADSRLLGNALRAVQKTIRKMWLATQRREAVSSRFLRQLTARLEDVYTVHPRSRNEAQQINGLSIPSFEELLKRNLNLDDTLLAPFSVLGHGDFNLDNIIFNTARRTVHLLDLHRSNQMDYVQDISVFLVSNFRLPVFDRLRRRRINRVTLAFYRFAGEFAQQQGDHSFPARLALGLVRSFVSSTRFEFNQPFADEMFERARYLLALVESYGGDWESFVFPEEIILY